MPPPTTARSARPTSSTVPSPGSVGFTTPATPASTGPNSTAVGDSRSSTPRRGSSSARSQACRGRSTWSASCSPAARSCCSARPSSRQSHLRPTLLAERLWCQLFSEPGAGSDLGALTTRAELDGDHYVVNGQKVWCSGGRYSDWGILMARTQTAGTDPDAGKHDGISFFLFPMDLPGVEVRPLRQMTGEAEFDEVFLTDVELPAEHLLGPLHGGWGVGMAVLTNERGHIGTAVIGLERRLEQLAAIADGDDESDLGPSERQQLAGLAGARTGLPGDGAAARTSRVDRGVVDEARDHRDDVRRGDAARCARRRRQYRRRAGGVWHAGCTRWKDRRRHEPDPAQHHRRTSARAAQRTQAGIVSEVIRQTRDSRIPNVNRPVDDDDTSATSGQSGPPVKLIVLLVVAILTVVFVFRNGGDQQIDFLFFDVETRTWTRAGDGGRARRRARSAVHQLVAAAEAPQRRLSGRTP